jgi:hypothetical protein
MHVADLLGMTKAAMMRAVPASCGGCYSGRVLKRDAQAKAHVEEGACGGWAARIINKDKGKAAGGEGGGELYLVRQRPNSEAREGDDDGHGLQRKA